MNTRRDPDRLIHAFLMEGSTELADEVYDMVRDRIEQTRQRTVIGPWREPDVNRYFKIALAVAAVVVVAVVGFRQFGGANVAAPGGSGSPSPTTTPTVTAEPSGSSELTESFTSDLHGVTFSYPSGWTARPATEPWTTGFPDFGSNAGDVIYDPVRDEGHLWIVAASQPIGASTPDEWVAEKLALDDGCPASEPISVGGATGLIGADGCTRAAVTRDGRGYFIVLYTSGDEPSLADTYDSTWLKTFLATVQLPSAATAAPLTETFTSERYGVTFSYPSGWTARPATETWTTRVPGYSTTDGDVVYDPVRQEGDLWISVASQPIGDSAPDAWAAETIAIDDGCTPTEQVAGTVDGATGLIGTDNCTRAAVTKDGRGYIFWLYTSGDLGSVGDSYGTAWFEDFLATVRLQPGT